jgi:membrane associated rhomboid family serine protease
MLLPYRSKNPPESLPIVTVLLIVANVFVFILTSNGFEVREEVVNQWGLTGNNFGPLHMLTSMFLHADVFHLLGNMWFLYLFGFAVEGRIRSLAFVALYLAAGASGDLLHHLLFGMVDPTMPSIGASGAIMGVMGAALYMFPFGQVSVFYWLGFVWYGTFSVPIWGVSLWYLGTDLLLAMFVGASSGVGHLAHLGGAAGGFLFCAALRFRRDSALASDAKAIFSDMGDLSLLSQAELAEMNRFNPNDTTIALNWMHRSLREQGGVRPECVASFLRLLPKMLQEHEVGTVGYCVAALAYAPGTVSVRDLLQVAGALEKFGEANLAVRLYEAILREPAAGPADRESATFRIGIISECVFGNHQRAAESYRDVIRQWPMSPFAEQARARLAAVEGSVS